MIKLTDYIVETQGYLAPGDILANRQFFNMKTNEMIKFPLVPVSHFDLVGKTTFKIKPMIIKSMFHYNQFNTEDLYVLDKIGELLYEV